MASEQKFGPCPTCRQYSHSIGEDKLAEAFNHFQSMFSHRGDGIPTQHSFDERTRDMAQVLMAAADTAADERRAVVEECARVLRNLEPPKRRWINREQAIEAIRAIEAGDHRG